MARHIALTFQVRKVRESVSEVKLSPQQFLDYFGFFFQPNVYQRCLIVSDAVCVTDCLLYVFFSANVSSAAFRSRDGVR